MLITNLKPLRSHQSCKAPLLLMSSANSSVKEQRNSYGTSNSGSTLAADGFPRRECESALDLMMGSGDLRTSFLDLDEMAAPPSSLEGCEVSFDFILSDWTLRELENESTDKVSTIFKPVDLELIGYSAARVCVILVMTISSKDMLRSFSWLSRDSAVVVRHALLMRVDRLNDILVFGRYDRTIITAAVASELPIIKEEAEEVRRRISALRASSLSFKSVFMSNESESCSRIRIANVSLQIISELSEEIDLLVLVDMSATSIHEQERMVINRGVLSACLPHCSPSVLARTRLNVLTVNCTKELESTTLRRIKWISKSLFAVCHNQN